MFLYCFIHVSNMLLSCFKLLTYSIIAIVWYNAVRHDGGLYYRLTTDNKTNCAKGDTPLKPNFLEQKIMKTKTIKFTEMQIELINKEAESLGLNFSDFIRHKIGIANKNQYNKFLFEVNKIGNNLNQIAKALNKAALKNQLDDDKMDKAITRLLAIKSQLNETIPIIKGVQ